MSEFQKRVTTGVVGIAILLSLIVWGGFWGTWVLAVAISFGMLWEFVEIVFSLPDRNEKRVCILLTAFLIALTYGLLPADRIAVTLAISTVGSFLFLFSYFLFTARRYDGAAFLAHCQELMFSIFGLVYLAMLPLFLAGIRRQPLGLEWVVFFFLIVWSTDIGAYFVGRQWGRHKLYAKISPKKTVEGALGGVVFSALVAWGAKSTFLNQFNLQALIWLSLAVCVISQLGDLCESFLKRAFDKKDSGSILPGHGGFLDRFDSVVFSLPLMYAGIRALS